LSCLILALSCPPPPSPHSLSLSLFLSAPVCCLSHHSSLLFLSRACSLLSLSLSSSLARALFSLALSLFLSRALSLTAGSRTTVYVTVSFFFCREEFFFRRALRISLDWRRKQCVDLLIYLIIYYLLFIYSCPGIVFFFFLCRAHRNDLLFPAQSDLLVLSQSL
jgi:hypothetical protein